MTATLHVSPAGNDSWSGRLEAPDAAGSDGPFATLERARDEIRRLKQHGPLPDGGVTVFIRGGRYPVARPFTLAAEDSGTPDAPILYRACPGETPVFSGGLRLTQWGPVTDPAILARLPQTSRPHVVQVDLKAAGLAQVPALRLGGMASPHGSGSRPWMELFFDGRPLQLARWPNEGWTHIAGVDPADGPADPVSGGILGSRFAYEGDRPARWALEKDILLHGYWCWDWADAYERVETIDTAARTISLVRPCHTYGFREGQRYYALNLLCELDAPGEWYVDREAGVLYLYPPSDLTGAAVELSALAGPLVQADGASHLTLAGLTWELSCADAVVISGGQALTLAGCTIRRSGGNGVDIRGGLAHAVRSCDIYGMGRGGVRLSGGDRLTLASGRHVVENCDIHDLSRVDRTYTPALWVDGVGARLAHNWLHDVASSAIRLNGNDHLVEFNEVCRVVRESDDQGALDMWGNPTFRGNVIRHSYWHHVGAWRHDAPEPHCGQAAIRLDDAICATEVTGNIFYHCGTGGLGFGAIQIHGGKENVVTGNLFVACAAAVSFSAWGQARWDAFIARPELWSPRDKSLYLSRYPSLSQLSSAPDANTLSSNIVLHCPQLLLRDSGHTTLVDNLVTSDNPGFPHASLGIFRMAAPSPALASIHFPPIPFDDIGLRMDEYRNQLPSHSIAEARAGHEPAGGT